MTSFTSFPVSQSLENIILSMEKHSDISTSATEGVEENMKNNPELAEKTESEEETKAGKTKIIQLRMLRKIPYSMKINSKVQWNIWRTILNILKRFNWRKLKLKKTKEHPDDGTEKNDTIEVTVLKLDKQSEEYVEEYSDKTNENEQIIVEAVVHKNLEENKCEKC